MVNTYSIETYVDIRKLQFFGRLCNLSHNKLAKQVFIQRLYQFHFSTKCFEKHFGFIPDIIRTLEKYGLNHYLNEFILSSVFPKKEQWKGIVRLQVKVVQERVLHEALDSPKLRRYSNVYGLSLHVHPIWGLEGTAGGNRKYVRDFSKPNGVLNYFLYDKVCVYCKKTYSDQLDHFIHECSKYQHTRELFWSIIINEFSVAFSSYLYNLEDSRQTEVILGKNPDCGLSTEQSQAFLHISAKTWQILTYERELIFY